MDAPVTTPITDSSFLPSKYFVNFLNYLRNYVLPKGAIVLFYGIITPKGFLKCDGTNGTPNLTAPTGCVYGMKE